MNNPIFIGLTHIGQVFALGWAEKFGDCSVYDFNSDLLVNFRKGNLTNEEPNLPKTYKECIENIKVYESPEQIQNHGLVIITMDTPLTKDGEPIVENIKTFLKSVELMSPRN